MRKLLWHLGCWLCPELREPGPRLLFGTYMGTALARALPFRQRVLASVVHWYVARAHAAMPTEEV